MNPAGAGIPPTKPASAPAAPISLQPAAVVPAAMTPAARSATPGFVFSPTVAPTGMSPALGVARDAYQRAMGEAARVVHAIVIVSQESAPVPETVEELGRYIQGLGDRAKRQDAELEALKQQAARFSQAVLQIPGLAADVAGEMASVVERLAQVLSVFGFAPNSPINAALGKLSAEITSGLTAFNAELSAAPSLSPLAAAPAAIAAPAAALTAAPLGHASLKQRWMTMCGGLRKDAGRFRSIIESAYKFIESNYEERSIETIVSKFEDIAGTNIGGSKVFIWQTIEELASATKSEHRKHFLIGMIRVLSKVFESPVPGSDRRAHEIGPEFSLGRVGLWSRPHDAQNATLGSVENEKVRLDAIIGETGVAVIEGPSTTEGIDQMLGLLTASASGAQTAGISATGASLDSAMQAAIWVQKIRALLGSGGSIKQVWIHMIGNEKYSSKAASIWAVLWRLFGNKARISIYDGPVGRDLVGITPEIIAMAWRHPEVRTQFGGGFHLIAEFVAHVSTDPTVHERLGAAAGLGQNLNSALGEVFLIWLSSQSEEVRAAPSEKPWQSVKDEDAQKFFGATFSKRHRRAYDWGVRSSPDVTNGMNAEILKGMLAVPQVQQSPAFAQKIKSFVAYLEGYGGEAFDNLVDGPVIIDLLKEYIFIYRQNPPPAKGAAK